LEVYGREAEQDGDETGTRLAPVQHGERVNTNEVEIREAQTKPPPRFTEATLLTAMEGAGKLVDDDELRQAMAEKGLGTPATRAAIIEGLIEENYVRRQGSELQPTGKAFMLLNLLRRMGIEVLTKPELTGEWEFKLKQMEHGRLTRKSFIGEIANMTRHIVERAKTFEEKGGPDGFTDLRTPCPICGGTIRMNHRRYQCQKCEFSLPLFISGRLMEPEEIEELVEKRVLGPLTGFHSRRGFSYKATLRLNNEQKLEFDFGNGQQNTGDAKEPVDFSKQTPLGKCPRCGAPVFDSGTAYVCEKSTRQDKSCSFRSAKVILQQTIEPRQMSKLLADGRTDLLDGFVSRRNGRKFSAFLVLKDGDITFEFQPRTGKGGGEKKQSKK
ncbi:MAG: topoisomerase C-terminal repeat-containing protein, partial [Verrucomicrobiia bacterium]